jgi:hypothetical protein
VFVRIEEAAAEESSAELEPEIAVGDNVTGTLFHA